jgi:hypothetical protein
MSTFGDKLGTLGKSIWPSRTSVRWIIFLLVIAVISLSYIAFFNQVEFKESVFIKYLSYTSSLLSFLLSVFAIFYAYLTSIDTSNKLSSIENTVTSLNVSTNDLKNNNEQLHNLILSLRNAQGGQANPSQTNKGLPQVDNSHQQTDS